MNETPLLLDDLALFHQVALSGGLSAAARELGMPLPTLSRRMNRLERDTAKSLFLRGPHGYALTAEGRALSDALEGIPDLRRRVAGWRTSQDGPAQIRITAGFWTSRHLARHLRPDAIGALWVPLFVPSNANLDIARREVDIGIRNHPPDHPWLARRRLRQIDHAIFARDKEVMGYVSLPSDAALPPSQRWLHAHHGAQIVTTASDTRLCLDLALSGFGRVVMPCFVGDAEPGLTRLSDPIPELRHEEWLVCHHDARAEPPLRAALDSVAEALCAD